MSVSPGQSFGSYEIAASIGAGGMGEVHRARDTNLKRDVALKLLPQAFLEDQDRLARFRREAEMLAALNHPNIAQVYGLEKAEGQTAIVMELVEGPTLADRIQQGPIPADEAMAIALQIVAALEAAHAKGIVHRDLKPANVKVREDGTVKVLDFGISKPIDPKLISGTPVATTPAMTQTGIILGTAAYMSPEQARGKFVDERTDIWAFGCLLFEMLTGQPAFGGEDMMAVLARVIDRDTDLSSIPKAISPAVRHTIFLCLQKDPRKRIADIRDVRLALEGNFESEQPRSGGSARPSQPAWQRALVHGGVLAAGAALTALIGVSLWPEPRPPQVSRWVHVVPDALRPAFDAGYPLLAVAPNGGEFSYASIAGLVRRPLNEIESRLIQGTGPNDSLAPHYAGDGRSLFYGVGPALNPGPLRRIGTEGGTSKVILPTHPGNGWWPTADGALYGAMDNDRCLIARIPADGGPPSPVFEDPAFACFEPALLPGGRYFLSYGLSATDDTTGYILVHSIESQKTRKLFEGIQPTLVDSRLLVYFDIELGLSVRAFDPERAFDEDREPYGQPVLLVEDVLESSGGRVAHYRVSAGGETLVYLKRSSAAVVGHALARLRPDGTIERLPFTAAAMGYLSVAADGERVALSQLRDPATLDVQLWMLDLLGRSEPRRFSFEGGINDAPSWVPGEDALVFSSNRSGGQERIWRQDVTGSRPAEALTNPAAGSAHLHPVFAPDGRLGFTRRVGEQDLDLMIASLPVGEPEELRGGSGPQDGLEFSPDGNAFSYQSVDRVLVERYPRDGSSPLLVAEVPSFFVWPVWSSDSRRLAYQSGADEVTIVEIDTATLTARARPHVLAVPMAGTGLRMLDALPGTDDWLVVVDADPNNNDSRPEAEIVVVQNWIEEIRGLVPPL